VDATALKSWRKELGYTQHEAAQKLGVTRGTVHNWECEATRVPQAVPLACHELTRRWKQRLEFGPVTLVYAADPVWEDLDGWGDVVPLQYEGHASNFSAIRRACVLRETHSLNIAFIAERDGHIVWTSDELRKECDRQRAEAKLIREALRGTGLVPLSSTSQQAEKTHIESAGSVHKVRLK